jgi:hypothetical protein
MSYLQTTGLPAADCMDVRHTGAAATTVAYYAAVPSTDLTCLPAAAAAAEAGLQRA